MDRENLEHILREVCEGLAMQRLDRLARELTGVGLLVVWHRGGENYGQMAVCGNDSGLPRFCRLLHRERKGLLRCVTCHSLLALAAHTPGQILQGCCHGGACVLAAHASDDDLPSGVDIVVISSCAFSQAERKRGWRVTRRFARDLGLDMGELRQAYAELPELQDDKLKIAGTIIDTAAAVLSDAVRARMPDAGHAEGSAGMEEKLKAALQSSRATEYRHVTGTAPSGVVDVVLSVVGANPNLPVTVADIARAAHMSPNHFSLIFRRRTGKTFTDFLSEVRLKAAKERLRNPTLSIGEVAHQAGFSDPNYFSKFFHKCTGMSPGQWRHPRRRSIQSGARQQPPKKSAAPAK